MIAQAIARSALLALGLCAALQAPVCAQSPPAGADPKINQQFLDADPRLWAGRFEGESREVFHKRADVVAVSGAAPGMVVADVGAGTGFFAMLFAQRVAPGGRVIAVDISKPFLEAIAERARRESPGNVETRLGTHTDTGLPEGAVDIVFTSDTYHHFEQVAPILASIRRALKPGGRFIVVDFERIAGVTAPSLMSHVRAGKETVIAEVERAGFRLREEVRSLGLRENYYLIFERAG